MKIDEAIEELQINGKKEPLEISGSATRMMKYFKALAIASEALEKQIAKKVIVRDIGVDTYDCPSCENIYLSCGGVYKYCPNCGQKLDWSGVDVEAKED